MWKVWEWPWEEKKTTGEVEKRGKNGGKSVQVFVWFGGIFGKQDLPKRPKTFLNEISL